MSPSMETRNARVFDVEEPTEISECGPVDVSAPTVVLSAAPLKTVVESSAPTRREIPVARPPGVPMGAPRAVRGRLPWAEPLEYETAPVGPIPMPGERPSADVVTIVQQLRRAAPVAARAAERPAQYVVGGNVAVKHKATPRSDSRGALALVGIVGLLAGFVMVLSVVVVRQQTELRENRVPAQRAAQVCATYDAEVRAIAGELTQRAGDVEAVEHRIGERARGVVAARSLQQLCVPDEDPTRWACASGEAACLAEAVMQLRQALAHR